jgi:pyruvate formate lyase activating enzyme
MCRKNGIHSAVDTSGYADKALFRKIIHKTDLFLFDLKLMDPVKHLRFIEASNAEILENLSYLLSKHANVIIRIPMIRNVTATSDNLEEMALFLNRFDAKPRIAMLPFHNIGETKYKKFNLKYRIGKEGELSRNEIGIMAKVFENRGLTVTIG